MLRPFLSRRDTCICLGVSLIRKLPHPEHPGSYQSAKSHMHTHVSPWLRHESRHDSVLHSYTFGYELEQTGIIGHSKGFRVA